MHYLSKSRLASILILFPFLGLISFICFLAEDKKKHMYKFPDETGFLEPIDGRGADDVYVVDDANAPWGDYGAILYNGLLSDPERESGDIGVLRLERTGPFVPPVTFPGRGTIVVTSEMKSAMIKAGFKGISFQPVRKVRIVDLSWQDWDQSAPEPFQYPEFDDPVGYILYKHHSPKVSAAIGDLWEVILSDSAKVVRHKDPEGTTSFEYVSGSWNGNDLFSVDENYYIYCSPRAHQWFKQHFEQWVSLSPEPEVHFSQRDRK